MKPEHTKEFNAEHAQAGAPYCQRNGLAARIGIWDGRRTDYPLVGEAKYPGGNYHEVSWTSSGIFSLAASSEGRDLVMLPLGMCEGKPVFVGDVLFDEDNEAFDVTVDMDFFDRSRWPRTAPVMPRWFDNEYDNDVMVKAMVIRPAIESYWKALDEFNGVRG